jgi:hypothetical protein
MADFMWFDSKYILHSSGRCSTTGKSTRSNSPVPLMCCENVPFWLFSHSQSISTEASCAIWCRPRRWLNCLFFLFGTKICRKKLCFYTDQNQRFEIKFLLLLGLFYLYLRPNQIQKLSHYICFYCQQFSAAQHS